MEHQTKIFAILDEVHAAGAQCTVVTKYLSADETYALYKAIKEHPAFASLGENRAKVILNKCTAYPDLTGQIDMIGNIQSRDIRTLTHYCRAIQSVTTLRHFKKIRTLNDQIPCFLQVNITEDPQKHGVMPEDLATVLQTFREHQNPPIGISSMGSPSTAVALKNEEYWALLQLQKTVFPGAILSAGTSHDYKIALAHGVKRVRLGRIICQYAKNNYSQNT